MQNRKITKLQIVETWIISAMRDQLAADSLAKDFFRHSQFLVVMSLEKYLKAAMIQLELNEEVGCYNTMIRKAEGIAKRYSHKYDEMINTFCREFSCQKNCERIMLSEPFEKFDNNMLRCFYMELRYPTSASVNEQFRIDKNSHHVLSESSEFTDYLKRLKSLIYSRLIEHNYIDEELIQSRLEDYH